MDTSASLCPCLLLSEFSFDSCRRPVLGIFLDAFSRKVKRPGRIHSLAVARSGTCSPWYLSIPEPFGKSIHVIPLSMLEGSYKIDNSTDIYT